MATTRIADSTITNGTKYNTMSAGNYSPGYLTLLATSANIYNNRSAIDTNGNIYLYGNVSSTVNTLQKYNKFGILIWQKSLTNSSTYGGPQGIAISPDNASVYISSDIPDVTPSVSDISVIKLNSDGVIQWQRRYEFGGAYDENSNLSVDSSGNIYIGGDTTNAGYRIIRIKIDSNGSILEQHTYTEGNVNFGGGAFLDSSNRLYQTSYNSPTGVTYDTVLVRFDTSPGSGTNWARKVAIGSAFNSPTNAMSGTSGGDIYFASNSLTGTNYTVLFKYNTSGTLQWQRKLSTSFSIIAQGVSVDSSGNAYVLITGDPTASFLVKYDSSGTIQWQRRLSSDALLDGLKIQVIDSNNLLITGRINTGTYLNDFVFSLPTDGSQIGRRPLGPITITYATASLTDAAGSATATSPSFTLYTPSYTTATITNWSVANTSYTEYNTRLP
jgi:hypothetical protein